MAGIAGDCDHTRSVDNAGQFCRYLLVGNSMRVTRGFTLVELMIATAIAGIGGALIVTTLTRQQRFYSSAQDILDVRSQLRDGADVLAEDIRGAAVGEFGFPMMSDTAIEMYTTIGTSVACAGSAGNTIGLPPAALVSGNILTSLLSPPDTGDVAEIYNAPGGVADSARWETYPVTSFTSRSLASVCPATTGFTTPGDSFAGATGYSLVLGASPSVALRPGAPIHFLRRVRYSLYKSSDGWYLGFRKCGAVSCPGVQPVSGPYKAYRASGGSGLSFRYYDALGNSVSSSSASNGVARVDIVLRGESSHISSFTGDAATRWADSAVVTVSPRNRLR